MKKTIRYNTSVFTPAGWRNEVVTAICELNNTGKKGVVVEVIDIGGNGNSGYSSRTGAKRQTYNVGGVAQREIGMVKIISKCEIIA